MIQLSYFHPFPYMPLSQNTLFGIWSFLWTCLLYPPWEDPWEPESLSYLFGIPDKKSELLKIMLMRTDKKSLGRKKPKSRTTSTELQRIIQIIRYSNIWVQIVLFIFGIPSIFKKHIIQYSLNFQKRIYSVFCIRSIYRVSQKEWKKVIT